MDRLKREGLVEHDGRLIKVAKDAHAAVRVVCAEFDRYLSPSQNRHATAV